MVAPDRLASVIGSALLGIGRLLGLVLRIALLPITILVALLLLLGRALQRWLGIAEPEETQRQQEDQDT